MNNDCDASNWPYAYDPEKPLPAKTKERLRSAIGDALDALDAAEALSQERRNSLTREIAHKQLAMAERDSYKSDAHALRSLAAQCEAQWPEPGKTAAEIVTDAVRAMVARAEAAEARAAEAYERGKADGEVLAYDRAYNSNWGPGMHASHEADMFEALTKARARALALAKEGGHG